MTIFCTSKVERILVAEFSVSNYSTPKFICASDDGVPRLLITENDNIDKKSNLYRFYIQFKIEFITNAFSKVIGK